MAEKNKTTVSKIIGEVTAMLTGIMAVFFALCFCAVFQESRIRERQYKEHGIAAYFKTEFEQMYAGNFHILKNITLPNSTIAGSSKISAFIAK